MLFVSINYNNNLGFLLTFLLGSILFMSIFHTARNMYGIHVLHISAAPVHVGNHIKLVLKVKSPDRPKYSLCFKFKTSDDIYTNLESGITETVSVTLKAKKRGYYNPWPLKISTRYPLGLFYSWTNYTTSHSFLIYPKPLEYSNLKDFTDGSDTGINGNPGPGTDDFKGFRKFKPGEPVKHISWKKSPMGKGLLIKEFEGYEVHSPIFNWDQIKTKNKEKKISYLCHLVLIAQKKKISFGLDLPGINIESGMGKAHTHNCLKALSLI